MNDRRDLMKGELEFLRTCEKMLVEVRSIALGDDESDPLFDKWLGATVGSAEEIPGLVRDRMEEIAALRTESTQLRSQLSDIETNIRAALVLIEDILDDDISALARSDVLALKGHLEDLVPNSLVCSICGAPAKYIANNERRCNEHKRVESGE